MRFNRCDTLNAVSGLLAGISIALSLSMACTHTPPTTTPQAAVAHYGTDVVKTVTALQTIVVSLTAGPTPRLTAPAAQPYMDTLRRGLLAAQQLDTALVAYDQAAPDAKATAGQQATAAVSAFLAVMATLPDQDLGLNAVKLAGTIGQLVLNIKLVLAGTALTGH